MYVPEIGVTAYGSLADAVSALSVTQGAISARLARAARKWARRIDRGLARSFRSGGVTFVRAVS